MGGRRRVGLGAFIVASIAFIVAVSAQQAPTFRSGIELIEVDATVIDRDGNPIPDLLSADFSVAVDGEPRAVVQAQFISLRAPEGSSLPADSPAEDAGYTSNADADPGRLIVILVDEESMPWGEGRRLMHAAAGFVDGLSPGDRVSVVAMPQPGVYIDFTSDHDRVRRAVEGMSGLGVPPRGGGLIEFEILQETRRRTAAVLHGIESILEGMRRVEGPKALVWISGGLAIGGEELGLKRMADLAAAARTTLYVFMLDELLVDGSRAVSGELPDAFVVESSPMRGGGPGGVGEPGDVGLRLGAPNRRVGEQGLMAAASMTGGSLMRTYYNAEPLFDRLERELSGYYLLGVESLAGDRGGEFRDIEVSVRRDGARVRSHRRVHVPPEDAGRGAAERLLRLLRSPVPARELPLRVATYAYRNATSYSEPMRILIGAEVDAPGSGPATLEVGYLVRDAAGVEAARATMQVAPRLVQKPDGPVLEVAIAVPLEQPGAYSLKLAAIDAAGRRGSVEHPMPVPRLSSEPLVAGDLMLADQASMPAGRILPQIEAQVTSGRLLAFTELYARSPLRWDGPRVEVDVVDDAGGPVLARGPAVLNGPDGTRRRSATAVVAVPHLPPGRYVARARVMHDATEMARVRRPFRIVSQPVP
ncbi:MAG: VWA domain-containing protein [Acidobacteria bacterium]|nr:VWA domain-containing protein [Acidobacteriota bacterium]